MGLRIDEALFQRLGPPPERERILELQRELIAALGDHSDKFLELEALINEVRCRRDGACFDIGYEYGEAAGRGEVRRRSPLSQPARELAEHIRWRVAERSLPPKEAVLALIQCLWVMARALPAPSPAGDRLT